LNLRNSYSHQSGEINRRSQLLFKRLKLQALSERLATQKRLKQAKEAASKESCELSAEYEDLNRQIVELDKKVRENQIFTLKGCIA
jgi:hypothetical protein